MTEELAVTEGQEELPKLTVKKFIEDLSKFPQESEVVASLYGIGLTIPIFQALQVDTNERQLTILQISKQGAIKALEHGELEAIVNSGEAQAN